MPTLAGCKTRHQPSFGQDHRDWEKALTSGTDQKPLTIGVHLPYLFSVRDFLFTPVWQEMARRNDVKFKFVCHARDVLDVITERGSPNISPLLLPPTFRRFSYKEYIKNPNNILNLLWVMLFRYFDRRYLHGSLIYRFSSILNLSNRVIMRNKSKAERRKFHVFHAYQHGDLAGFPLSTDPRIYKLLQSMRHGRLNIATKTEKNFISRQKFDLFVFSSLHAEEVGYIAAALRELSIPMIGMVASWDHLTVRGPLPPGFLGFTVASLRMLEELSELHGVDSQNVCQIGKPQLDIIQNPKIFQDRSFFLNSLGIPSHHRLAVMGTNVEALRDHEVSIAKKLATWFTDRRFPDTSLLIRTHPQDDSWKADFLPLNKPPWVLINNASGFAHHHQGLATGWNDQVTLANLMKHANLVIQSRSSLALDAIAYDTPVVSLAFDGDLQKDSNDSFMHEYGYEHYKPIVRSRGTWMVGSYDALSRAIHGYLADPQLHADGREKVRQEHLEPLDGLASKRLVDYIISSAESERRGHSCTLKRKYFPPLNTRWATEQNCRIEDYIDR